ncbi:MAG: EFR1 family ferrodoxin, partial [Promethearchaeota archaeon]
IPIARIYEYDDIESTSEKVGFIFPLYYSGLPKIVHDFVKKINLIKSEYFFAVVTNAGDVTELPLQQIEKILRTKIKTLSAGFLITMPNNYIIGYDIHPESRQKEFFEEANKQIEKITEIIENRQKNLDPYIFKKDLSRGERFNAKFREDVNSNDKLFYAQETCTSCGICKEVCPVNNIIIVEGVPAWQHKCQQCLACINFCPEEAIQIGSSTLKTHRYHHPDITLQEIINQKKHPS